MTDERFPDRDEDAPPENPARGDNEQSADERPGAQHLPFDADEVGPETDEPMDLAAVHADDTLIEFLRTADPAQLRLTAATVGGDADLADMLTVWKAELERTDLPPVPVAEGVAVMQRLAGRRRGLRSAALVAASIVALLVGSAVVGSRSATPGDALWPVTRVVWAERAHSVEAGIQVRTALDEVRVALADGRPEDALGAIARADAQLPAVPGEDLDVLSQDLQALRQQIVTATVDRPATPTAEVDTPGAPAVTPSAPSSAASGTAVIPAPTVTTSSRPTPSQRPTGSGSSTPAPTPSTTATGNGTSGTGSPTGGTGSSAPTATPTTGGTTGGTGTSTSPTSSGTPDTVTSPTTTATATTSSSTTDSSPATPTTSTDTDTSTAMSTPTDDQGRPAAAPSSPITG